MKTSRRIGTLRQTFVAGYIRSVLAFAMLFAFALLLAAIRVLV